MEASKAAAIQASQSECLKDDSVEPSGDEEQDSYADTDNVNPTTQMQQQVTAMETMQAMIKAQEAFRRLSSQSAMGSGGGSGASLPMQLNTPNAALSLFMAAAAQNSVASMQQQVNESMS
ncbi:unnamed protein product [Sphagnum balticum]